MIKNYYKYVALFFLSILLGGTIVQAESGIDWEASYMMVEFSPETTAVPALSCFGYNDRSGEAGACNAYAGSYDNCVWEYLDTLGYSDENTSPDITNCYQQAGDYEVTIQLIDFAENVAAPITNDFVVRAGAPDPDTSALIAEAECSDLTIGATGGAAGATDNTCTLTLNIRDEFGNPVTQLQGQSGELYSEATFPGDANVGDLSFRTGTKIDGSFVPDELGTPINFTIGADDAVTTTFDMTAWAPSMRLVGTVLGKTEPFAYDLKFTIPSVDASGDLDLLSTVLFQYDQYAPQIGFAPWVRTILDLGINPKQYTLDVNTPFEITRNLILPATGGPNNPFNVFLTVHDLDPTLQIDNLNFDPTGILVNDPLETIISILRVAGDNAQTGGNISFSSRIEYDIVDGSTYQIAYPSGALGAGLDDGTGADDYNDEEINTSLIGVSVEGKILGSKDAVVINDPSSFNGVQISEGESLADIRREVFENAIRITRSITPKIPDTGENIVAFDATWFNNANVAYVVDEDVIITGATVDAAVTMPAGQKTLVIQNGNLIIEDDLQYASNLDSFGFILINDSIEIEPATGNVFVKDDVRKIVGTYFAEGGLMSIDDADNANILDTGAVTVADSDNGNGGTDPNILQLIIEGTMLTHNTLGGGIYQADSDTYITPWETLDASTDTAAKETRAQRYDLHYLRNYSPDFDEFGVQTNFGECYPGSDPCYPNAAATVIRYDGRAVKTPPPGYEGASYFAR